MKIALQSARQVLVGLACASFGSACVGDDAPSDDAASQGGTGGESSADDNVDSGTQGADASSGEESGVVPSTCPADLDNDVCELGDTCDYGDFDCDCVCGCDEGGIMEGPGYWECSYARADEVLVLSESSTVLDCVAGTITTDATLVVNNAEGVGAIDFHISGLYGTWLTMGDTEVVCSGLCPDGQPCPDGDPITVAAGTTAELVQQFGPATCEPPDDVDLCAFCGTTGLLRTYWGLTSGVAGGSGSSPLEVAITCP